ncbi:unnamed protein product [Paramecium sonneborni]|uniref:Transmembrane protein n=1 Tax=Paramecium sonneborni TaxID=65129 RepID=A0A8S1RG15_9CILI|nr:unnamed protein product [Paramecium sonneborni]
MQQPNIEEKQEINADGSPSLQSQKNESNNKYFTTKCKWISFSVSFFVLAGIGIFLGIYLSRTNSSAPTLKKFQRDEFEQVDEICMYHTSERFSNCTQIQIKTKRLVEDVNEKNGSSIVMLTDLKVQTFTQNFDGIREYNEMIDYSTEIQQELQKQFRILQKNESTQNDLCEGISREECGDINQIPLVTVVTDSHTGAIQSIGIPTGISDLILQPLVSNIIHIAPNLAESINNEGIDGTNGNRLLEEDIYYIGNQAFTPKTIKTKSWFGSTVIKKSIAQSDQIDGNSKGINLFDMFEQSQETSLDNNNYLVSSHITTNSQFSNSVKNNDINQDTDDLSDKSKTEITNDSNLITVETKSDEELTNLLSEIQKRQTLQFYSMQDLQNKISGQEDLTQDSTQNQDQLGGNRLLNENGDVQSNSETDFEEQEGECLSNIFNQKRTLKEVSVLKQKVGLQAEFQGEIKEGNVSGYLRSCVSLNGACLVDLYRRDFQYEGKPLKTFEMKGSQSKSIFSTVILIMGYPLTVGADYNYKWGYIESAIKTESDLGISEQIYASLSVTAYGEMNIIVIRIRAGVSGEVFNGSAHGVAQFRINQIDNTIIPDKYMIYLDFQIEALKFDLYAIYQHPTISWGRRCFRIFRKKICIYYPQFGWSSWKDVYRKAFQLAKLQASKRIFQLTSKCYD